MTSTPAVRSGDRGLGTLVALVAAGGAVGAVVRHLVGLATVGDGLLAITLTINAIGTFALALLPLIERVHRSEAWLAAVGPGLLGGFTTLSAVNEQARALLSDGRLLLFAGYLLGTFAVCVLAAAAAGRVVAARALSKDATHERF